MNENINKENKRILVLEKRYSNALTPLSQIIFSSDYFFHSFCNIWVSVTPSDSSFTISPHNLALLHYPVPLKSTISIDIKFHMAERFSVKNISTMNQCNLWQYYLWLIFLENLKRLFGRIHIVNLSYHFLPVFICRLVTSRVCTRDYKPSASRWSSRNQSQTSSQ